VESGRRSGRPSAAADWHADHVYRHEPTALLVFALLAMLCLDVFLPFYRRDLDPAARQAASGLRVSGQMAAALYADRPAATPRLLHAAFLQATLLSEPGGLGHVSHQGVVSWRRT